MIAGPWFEGDGNPRRRRRDRHVVGVDRIGTAVAIHGAHPRRRPVRRLLAAVDELIAEPDVVASCEVADAREDLIPEHRVVAVRRQRDRVRVRHGVEMRNVAGLDLRLLAEHVVGAESAPRGVDDEARTDRRSELHLMHVGILVVEVSRAAFGERAAAVPVANQLVLQVVEIRELRRARHLPRHLCRGGPHQVVVQHLRAVRIVVAEEVLIETLIVRREREPDPVAHDRTGEPCADVVDLQDVRAGHDVRVRGTREIGDAREQLRAHQVGVVR